MHNIFNNLLNIITLKSIVQWSNKRKFMFINCHISSGIPNYTTNIPFSHRCTLQICTFDFCYKIYLCQDVDDVHNISKKSIHVIKCRWFIKSHKCYIKHKLTHVEPKKANAQHQIQHSTIVIWHPTFWPLELSQIKFSYGI